MGLGDADPADHPALSYFRGRYPSRDHWAGSRLFRSGEAARRSVVRDSLPELDGLDVLDVGCGDGVFLSSVVKGKPRLLRLEDLVPEFTQCAHDRMRDQAEHVEVGVVDSCHTECEKTFDVVLAIGVTDYQHDWVHFIEELLRRTTGRLIVDVPRERDLLNQLRRLWLWLHGIRLQTSSRHGLSRRLESLCQASTIHFTRHNWILCIDPPPGEQADDGLP
ncbi:MAG: methyltransferase domain-containing protein [Gemmatimonadetes bacterium]|jgi:SAM-dependent methyltransferase|nr:methyltransferase domain-containing protein [Gemmatimonadota bacterium]MBT7864041.1 methyltransferase domain-containing protein [Gemmatimonadota bacterium]